MKLSAPTASTDDDGTNDFAPPAQQIAQRDSLICHGGLADMIAMALLAKAMALPPRLAWLVATVSLMSLSSPYFQPAFRTAIALSAVATDTDCERRAAGRVGAKPKPQNSVPVNIHLSHSEYCVI